MFGKYFRLEPGPLADAFRACKTHFAYTFGFSAALNILYLAPSLYMLNVYDRVLVSGGTLTLIFLTLALLAALLALSGLDAIRSRLMVAANQRLDRLLSSHLLRFAMGERDAGYAAQSRSQVLRDFDQFRAAVTGAPALAACDLPWAPLFVIICFIIHPAIGSFVLIGGFLLALVAAAGEQASRSSIRRQIEAATSYALVESDAASAETGRVLGMREALVSRQLAARSMLVQAQSESSAAIGGYTAVTKFLRQFLQSAVLGLGAWLAVQQQISAGGIIAGSILAARAFSPIEQLVGAWRQLGTGLQSFNSIKTALSQAVGAERTALPAPKGAIQLENVHVKAPVDGWILQNISLSISAGEIIGIVGSSGAGKTTLARVMCGALRPTVGVVRIDGASLSDWDAEALGKFIGYVPQDTRLFTGTVAANIGRFRSRENDPLHDEKVVAAAKAAGAHDLILRLPKGYDTMIQPNGAGLSAGQSQRVVLARALFGNPPLLVLDEPNSHLDAQGEAALVEALSNARARGATVIVVAHRAGFMSIADKIIVVRDGKIERFGPRDQIAARLTPVAGGKAITTDENRNSAGGDAEEAAP